MVIEEKYELHIDPEKPLLSDLDFSSYFSDCLKCFEKWDWSCEPVCNLHFILCLFFHFSSMVSLSTLPQAGLYHPAFTPQVLGLCLGYHTWFNEIPTRVCAAFSMCLPHTLFWYPNGVLICLISTTTPPLFLPLTSTQLKWAAFFSKLLLIPSIVPGPKLVAGNRRDKQILTYLALGILLMRIEQHTVRRKHFVYA